MGCWKLRSKNNHSNMSIDSVKYHSRLARYFSGKDLYLDEAEQQRPDIRKSVEQPWQLIKAGKWNGVRETLCDIFFIATFR